MRVAVRNRQRLLRVNTPLLKRIAAGALDCAGLQKRSLLIVLVTDRAIAAYNEQFHHVTGPTDILAFDYGDPDEPGELVISVEHVISQAKRYRSTAARELALYVVHGVLHLAGHDDIKPRDRLRMRSAERWMMARLSRQFEICKVISSSR
jgi:probable rRNA maturation factor